MNEEEEEINGKNKWGETGKRKTQKRRYKKIREKLTKFTVLYSNIRHLKTKTNSLERIVEEEKPTVIILVETKLGEEEDYKIEGYDEKPMNRNENGGGILIFVRNEIKHITVIVKKEEEGVEALWITINNGRNNIRIGAVYAPQESRTPVGKLKIMYKKLREQIKEAKTKNQHILMIGDFNCKVGKYLKNNKEEVTSGGKMLLNMIKDTEMELVNKTNTCKGLWTRVEGNQKSVLDYVIMNKDDLDLVEEMTIDEERSITPWYRCEEEHRDIYM